MPAYYLMCGKDFGSGTSVALTSVGLPGLGVRLGQHVVDPFTPVPKDSAPAQVHDRNGQGDGQGFQKREQDDALAFCTLP